MKKTIASVFFILTCLSVLAGFGCGGETATATREQLMDPEECASCHPDQFREWSGSMHAYAANDPVFLAMNARGQRETNGELGDFCVQCHAPMAVELGLTSDGLNLNDIPQKYKGVTCYFCHSVKAVNGRHNNPIELADDDVLRGGVTDPIGNGFHKSTYSELLDGSVQASSPMCGSCHDIVLPNGVHLERTFEEWENSLFSRPIEQGGSSCTDCHMKPIRGPIADFDGVPLRNRHDHRLHGVDVAVTDWPEKQAQLEGIADDLYVSVDPQLCINPAAGGIEIDIILKNIFAGHRIPSGSSFDRRGWVEVKAYDDMGNIVMESGTIADGDPVADSQDPRLWQIRDYAYDGQGSIAHHFWEIESVESATIPEPLDPQTPHSISRKYKDFGDAARVTMIMKLRPIGLEVIDSLIASGDLDPALRANFPTHVLTETELEWTAAMGFGCVCRQGSCP